MTLLGHGILMLRMSDLEIVFAAAEDFGNGELNTRIKTNIH